MAEAQILDSSPAASQDMQEQEAGSKAEMQLKHSPCHVGYRSSMRVQSQCLPLLIDFINIYSQSNTGSDFPIICHVSEMSTLIKIFH